MERSTKNCDHLTFWHWRPARLVKECEKDGCNKSHDDRSAESPLYLVCLIDNVFKSLQIFVDGNGQAVQQGGGKLSEGIVWS